MGWKLVSPPGMPGAEKAGMELLKELAGVGDNPFWRACSSGPPMGISRTSSISSMGVMPAKTVHAVAVMPRLSSLRGKNPPVDGGGEAEAWAAAAWEATWAARKAGDNTTQGKTTSAARRSLVSFRRVPTSIRVQPAHK